jgi:hypothetical protein
MATLNNNSKFGYVPQNAQGQELTLSYEPNGYNSNITGVHSPGVAPDKLVDPTQQSANNSDATVTTPTGLVCGIAQGGFAEFGGSNAPDNWLPCTQVIEQDLNTPITNAVETAGVTPQVNAAQQPSAGKSLSPGRG